MKAAAILILAACSSRDLTDDRYQGMVELEQTDLAFEVAGRIISIDVVPGAAVKQGQPVAHLDDVLDRANREVRARELDEAKADLALVKAGSRGEDIRAARAEVAAAQASEDVLVNELEREKKLVASGATTQSRLEDLTGQLARARGDRQSRVQRLSALSSGARAEEIARAEAHVAEAQQLVELADRTIEKRVLLAPLDAVVLDIYPRVGEVVGGGAPVLSLVDRSRPYADVFVPVADAPKARRGAQVAVVVEGDPNEIAGIVERIYPQLEFTPRYVYSPRERPNLLIRMRVRLDDHEGRLHAGLPAYARLVP